MGLRQYMTQEEYGDLFAKVNASLRSASGFRARHIAIWVPMVAFWVVGGFMLMIWGRERAKNLAVAAIGTHMDPFCKAKDIKYVIVMATPALKRGGQSNPTTVRFVLPSQNLTHELPEVSSVMRSSF